MSNSSSSFSSSTFSSFSSSSTSSGGRTTGSTHSTQSHTTPAGTTVRTSSSNHGEPVVEETRHYDSAGRELLEAPGGNQPSSSGQRRITDIEVEDVTDETEADKLYRERMEDEYAKREGGA
ncbi:hypothetical protein MBLNU459_g1330t2 [Dothideomycetes sp. NU459]